MSRSLDCASQQPIADESADAQRAPASVAHRRRDAPGLVFQIVSGHGLLSLAADPSARYSTGVRISIPENGRNASKSLSPVMITSRPAVHRGFEKHVVAAIAADPHHLNDGHDLDDRLQPSEKGLARGA